MTHALSPLTKDLIDALAASAGAWLVRLLGVLTAPGAQRRRRPMRRFLNHIERDVERIGQPDEIAGMAVFLASRAGAFTTGQTFVIDGGVMAV